MAGTAKTDAFMLGTATVMVGPQDKLFDLNPDEHSIGLVKNFSITSDPQYTDLTQGVKNTNVMSVMTQNEVSASMEVYEYTARNVTYALGLDGSKNTRITDETTTSSEQDGSTSAVTDLQVTDSSLFSAGDFAMVSINDDDHAYIRRVSSVSTDTLTLHTGIGVTIPSGAKVFRLNKVGIGSKEDQPFFSSKVVGKLANGDPVTILIPKIRVVNGFNLSFGSDDFANLPMEFTIFDLTSTDPNFSFFGGDSARMFGR
jgi:hypothetical protein